MKQKYEATCVFCDQIGLMTDDHIPPQAMFDKPRPTDLLFVPGCDDCNRGWSKDDEYFKTAVALSEYSDDSPHGVSARESSLRALQKPEAQGFTKMFLSKVFHTDVYSAGGVYVGRRLAMTVDNLRIEKVVSKIVRGLFFVESTRLLTKQFDVSVDTNETLEQRDPDFMNDLRELILHPLSNCPERVIADGAFRYRYAIPDSELNLSVWALTFYNTLPFLCLTGPVESNVNSTER